MEAGEKAGVNSVLVFFFSHNKLTLCECFQNNFAVAAKLLKDLHREAKAEKKWSLQWVHSYSSYIHKRSQSQGPVDQISAVLKTIPLLGKQLMIYKTYFFDHLIC